MSKGEKEILGTIIVFAIVVAILAKAIHEFRVFIDANNWMHIIFASIWLGVAIWMFFLVRKDIRDRKIGLFYFTGLNTIIKPAVFVITIYWAITQLWKSLLFYPWLLYIPTGIIAIGLVYLAILGIKYIIKNIKNKKMNSVPKEE